MKKIFKKILEYIGFDDSDDMDDDFELSDDITPTEELIENVKDIHVWSVYRRKRRCVCPECKSTLEDITLPDCPACGKSIKGFFDPGLSFTGFKKDSLSDTYYWDIAKSMRKKSGGGWSAIILCLSGCILYGYGIIQILRYAFHYRNVFDGIAGMGAAGLFAAFAYFTYRKIKKIKDYNMDEAVWTAVCDDFQSELNYKRSRSSSIFKMTLIKKSRPISRIYHVLADGDHLTDGYKDLFFNADNKLVLIEVWDPAERGYEALEIPVEKIAGFKGQRTNIFRNEDKRSFSDRCYDALKEYFTTHFEPIVLEYTDESGEIMHIRFLGKGAIALYLLLPQKALDKKRLSRKKISRLEREYGDITEDC